MGKLANFFSRFSADKFPKDSHGRKLNETKPAPQVQQRTPSPNCPRNLPSEGATKAAEAALNRIAAKQVKSKTAVKRQIEAELSRNKQLQQEAEAMASKFTTNTIEVDKCNSLRKVSYWCPSLLDPETKGSYAEIDEAIEKTLLDEVLRDPASAYTLLLIRSIESSQLPMGIDTSDESALSLWTIRQKRRENFGKIIHNLVEHPETESFWRLRMSNKLIVDLLGLKHATSFFEACGFSQKQQPTTADDGAPLDKYLSFSAAPTETQLEHLKSMLELLDSGQPILPKLYRDTIVLKLSGSTSRALTRDELPEEFFFVSRDDVRKILEEQHKVIEEGGMLLTKAMRERLRVRERRVYRYVLIRVRMPGDLLLQGTFLASESLADIHEWLSSCILAESTFCGYRLWAPPGTQLPVPPSSAYANRPMTSRVSLDDCFLSTSLVDLGLAPCALLTLSITNEGPGSPAPVRLVAELEQQLSVL